MNTPSFLESHVSQIPAIQFLQKLPIKRKYSIATPYYSMPPTVKSTKGLAVGKSAGSFVLNRPATPLNDAQLGGYFFAQMPRVGSIAA